MAATSAWERLGQPYRVAYARFRQAEALRASRGDRDAAAEALRGAAEVTGRLGARPADGQRFCSQPLWQQTARRRVA